MNGKILSVFINLVTYLTFQALIIGIIFLSGLAANDRYTIYQWLIYFSFMLIHIGLFIWVPLFRNPFNKRIVVVWTLVWLVTALYIAL